MSAFEFLRTLPTTRAVVLQAQVMHVMEGAAEIETELGTQLLSPGMALALGRGRWCRIRPCAHVRIWAVFVDEHFLVTQMSWCLPVRARVRQGLHPSEWDGAPMVLAPGVSLFQRVEPLWRQIAMIHDGVHHPEQAAVRTIELFAQWARAVTAVFLAAPIDSGADETCRVPISGRLTDSAAIGQVGHAAKLLRQRMHEPWTVEVLAREVALSRSHLTSQFTQHMGLAPMRFLTEIRLTEFARLIEETDLSVGIAAKTVGWSDPRVASAWFRRRFGVTPSQFRLTPQPHSSVDQRLA